LDLRSVPAAARSLPPQLVQWARSVAVTEYDRVVNLTFTPQSGRLTALFNAADTRGVTVGAGGTPIVKDFWLAHVVDLHQFRSFNRFNIADLYALGGSGPGPFAPITLTVPNHAKQWAVEFLGADASDCTLVAVNAGASNLLKAWRPEYYGRTMAALSQRTAVTFVLIGASCDRASALQVMDAYRAAGGTAIVHDAVGRTTIPQLAALLERADLLLTGDSGPMHVAVGVGTPVIDLSVGHASFHDTGPYGPGHWVVQPVMDCAPCSYQQVCGHHSCKDQIVPEQVAALALHVLGCSAFPSRWNGVRVYESGGDADGLACYRLKSGARDALADDYGSFWRRHWYEAFAGQSRLLPGSSEIPDAIEHQKLLAQLHPLIDRGAMLAERIAEGTRQQPIPLTSLKQWQTELTGLRARVVSMAMSSALFGPITVAFLRELAQCETKEASEVAEQQARAYRTWKTQLSDVMPQTSYTQTVNRAAVEVRAKSALPGADDATKSKRTARAMMKLAAT
jgi:ADP-heptose:LPS heptosyltransferase